MTATKRLVVEIPESQHRAIKAKALLRGMSMRDYVLDRLKDDDTENYDMADVTDSVVEALQQVAGFKKGKKTLTPARDLLNSID